MAPQDADGSPPYAVRRLAGDCDSLMLQARIGNLPGRAGDKAAALFDDAHRPRAEVMGPPGLAVQARLAFAQYAAWPWCAAKAFRPFPGTCCPGRMRLGEDKAKPAG